MPGLIGVLLAAMTLPPGITGDATPGIASPVAPAVASGVAPVAPALRPIRTNEPGTGVFIGSGVLGQVVSERRSNAAGEVLWDTTWVTDFRYTPATHWVFGVRVPYVLRRSLDHPDLGTVATSGLGDMLLTAKHRFFRSVGRWSDRHAAVEVGLELPTGSTDELGGGVTNELAGDLAGDAGDLRLPLQRRRLLQPGSGSTDFIVDLIYQEGRRRFVYGGDLSFRFNTDDDEGYRFGHELRLDLDLEYILLPLEYRRPGNEVFVLLEATLLHKGEDEHGDAPVPGSRRTELLLAPAVQHIMTEQLLLSLSVQFPVHSDVDAPGLERDVNILGEFRYAF